jgi:hypothetical protein
LFSVLLYAGLLLQSGLLRADDLGSKSHLLIAQSAASEQSSGGNDPAAGEEKRLSPEQKMRRRFPQPVKVGDLIGLPVLDWGDVTIEVVAILGRQLAALDMSRAEFDKAPAWSSPQTAPIPPNEMIQIAITRR